MKTMIAALIGTLFSIQAFADLRSDITLLRSLAPEGSDVAGIQAALLDSKTTEDFAFEMAKDNFLIRDFNNDGINDILVIFEKDPVLKNQSGELCDEMNWEDSCVPLYGDRVIQYWQGQANRKTFDKVSENTLIVLRADEGGVYGDPLVGLEVTKKGSVVLNLYGGSAWRWSYAYTLQFRKNDFYLIGLDKAHSSTIEQAWDSLSTNLITGKVIRTWVTNSSPKVHRAITQSPVKPLAKLAKIKSQFE